MKKIGYIVIILCVLASLFVYIKSYAQTLEKNALYLSTKTSCDDHKLCTYDGISYARLIKDQVPVEDYPMNEMEYIGMYLQYEN